MYDLHTHSLLSDGVLLPSEIAVRYLALGYKVIAITDHSDYSNICANLSALTEFARHWPKNSPIKILPGVELTHLPLEQFKPLAKLARKKGAQIIIAHGETTAEPVVPGTNRAALEADIDILAHPGMITDDDIRLAIKRGVFLEVTARKGHRDCDAHVIERGLKLGAKLVINTDSHTPENILPRSEVYKIVSGFGLTPEQINKIEQDTEILLGRKK